MRTNYEGYTLRDLAHKLGLSPMGVLGRERLALRHLRAVLGSLAEGTQEAR